MVTGTSDGFRSTLPMPRRHHIEEGGGASGGDVRHRVDPFRRLDGEAFHRCIKSASKHAPTTLEETSDTREGCRELKGSANDSEERSLPLTNEA